MTYSNAAITAILVMVFLMYGAQAGWFTLPG